jgi:hypothetical protein
MEIRGTGKFSLPGTETGGGAGAQARTIGAIYNIKRIEFQQFKKSNKKRYCIRNKIFLSLCKR